MLDAVEGLIRELRDAGIPIATTEQLDAVRALTQVDLADRAEVQSALRATLVKTADHQRAFDVVFDLFFALRPSTLPDDDDAGGSAPVAGGGVDAGGGGGIAKLDDGRIRELLLGALHRDDRITAQRIARLLVDRHAGIQPGRPVAGTFSLLRTLRAVDLEGMLAELVRLDTGTAGGTDGEAGPLGELGRRLAIEDYQARVDGFRQEVEAEIRRRLVADRGSAAVARTLRQPLPEDVDFLTASQPQLAELRAVVQPLARKLAARLAEQRRHRRRGALDFRRTVRRSMSTGGVPAVPIFRRGRPAKPKLIVLADISGSVSAFAAFTLQLTYALRSEFAAVRCFVFVDGVDEVTDLLAESADIVAAARRINSAGVGVWLDGHSDYGHALAAFAERFGGQLSTRTTVLVLGDARTNYHAPRAEALAAVRRRAGRVYWLNPEPAGAWDSGDSVLGSYARHCDAVLECRNIRQLRAFVAGLADHP